MSWRLTIGISATLMLAAGAAAAQTAHVQATPVQFSVLPPGAPLNPDPRDLPRVPTVQLGPDFGGTEGGVGDAEDADPYGGGYGYGGNVYLPQQQGDPLMPRVRPIRPPDLRPPAVFRPQLRITPPAINGGFRTVASR